MKVSTILVLSLAALLLCGCLLKSLNPFFTEDEVVFNESFVGSWLDTDSSSWKIEQYQIPGGVLGKKDSLSNSYYIEYTEGETKNYFEAHLFKIDEKFYMDFTPIMDKYFDGEFYALHIIPVHSLARVFNPCTDSLKIQWYSEPWLVKLLEDKKSKISNQLVNTSGNSESIILTATTIELQDFIRKHGDDPEALNCSKNGSICVSLVRQ